MDKIPKGIYSHDVDTFHLGKWFKNLLTITPTFLISEVFPDYYEGLTGFDDHIGADCTTIQFQHDFRIHKETVEASDQSCFQLDCDCQYFF